MKTNNRFKFGSQDDYLNIHREWAEPTRAELLCEIARLKSLLAAAVVFAVGAIATIFIMAVMR